MSLSADQLARAIGAVVRPWRDERSLGAALVEALDGIPAGDVLRRADADAVIADAAARLNSWADSDHAAFLARLPKRRVKPMTKRRIANLLAHHSPIAVLPS